MMNYSSTALVKKFFLNKPQIKAMLVRAPIEIDIWGRGTGKSDGVIAERSQHNVFAMPRSKGIFILPTYEHGLTNTLPQVIEAWSRMGYYRDVHYKIGSLPSKNWNWKLAYNAPLSPKHAIYWFNGSCQVMISQDRAQNAAGPSIDYMIGDEAKHLDKLKLDETFQTLRGNNQYFGDKAEHQSIVFTSDMPESASGSWLFEYEEMMDQEAIDIILAIQYDIILLNKEYPGANKRRQRQIQRTIAEYERYLTDMRKEDLENGKEALVYYSEHSTLDNIEVLGEGYIKKQKRTLAPAKFQTSILNKKPTKIEGGFYPAFDESEHTYTAPNYDHLDSLNFDFDKINNRNCLFDADVNLRQPLEIGMDYNAKINSLVVGQERGNKFLFLNGLFVEPPLRLRHVVEKFCDYYALHTTKEVIYYFDHTAIGENASTDYSFADEVVDILESRSWNVEQVYVGQAPNFVTRYNYWAIGMQGGSVLPKPLFNRQNCKSLQTSMQNADVRQGPSGFEKDKSSERSSIIPPNEATHFSEAADCLYMGKYNGLLSENQHYSVPNSYI